MCGPFLPLPAHSDRATITWGFYYLPNRQGVGPTRQQRRATGSELTRIQQLQINTAYRLSLPRRVLNRIVGLWIRLGLPPRKYHILTVKGRRSGRLHSTPVSVVVIDKQRWLVAPYGTRNWVKNARVAGQVTLRRGGHAEVLAVEEEHDPMRCASVLKLYVDQEPITRRFFDAGPGAPIEAFAAEAHRHPVFRIPKRDMDTEPPS